ncbi:MAG: molecular chaperone HtpG [Pseudomonadota bacterium]
MTDTLEKPATHQFAAETARVLQLMIHALYTNRDIFLRELISNASDALDKLRYAAVTDGALLGDAPDLTIHLSVNEKAKTLTITDTGIGMSREDLIAHLGTIAKSGTSEFMSQLTGDSSKDVNLIGQFGVGFYSAFMVADKVTVESCKAGETDATRWESDGSGSYTVSAAPARARGTAITLHLKKDAKDYLDRHRLGNVVGTYSDHIDFPITLTDGEGVTHHLNEGSAIWTKPKAEVTDEQYQAFYRHVAHSPEKPWAVLHNKAEGKVEYTSLLFIPGIKPFDLFHPERKRRVKLYVKRVFITDEGVELIPPYLRFLRGVVDSADLPLNISRETLQKSAVLDKIRDSVTSRVLTELKKRAEKDPTEYAKFWDNFGAALKEGLCEGNAPRDKILDACRFYSSTSPDQLISLADYKARMREGQEAVYVITGDALATLKHSPQIEGFTKRGIEVLLLTDHVDDFWTGVTVHYGDLPFRSVTKAGADLEKFPLDEAEEKREETAETSADTTALCAAMQTLYGDAVREVRTTRKLAETPICLGIGEGDMDMRMERFLAEHKQLPKRAAKIVEINPTHPVIEALAKQVAAGGMNENTENALWLLLDQALIAEGEPVSDATAFARRLSQFLAKGLAA